MKTSTSTALAALVAATLGMGGLIAPAAFAQDSAPAVTQPQTPPVDARFNGRGGPRQLHMMRGQMGGQNGAMRGGLLNLVCSDRGAEALEIMFVRMDHRLELTDAQQPLFDTLKTKALTAQTSFADTCTTARPAADAQTAPNLVDGIKARIAVQTAETAALNDVLPDLEAFYNSLTDTQKAALTPSHNKGTGHGRHLGQNRMDHRMGPGDMMKAPAPTTKG